MMATLTLMPSCAQVESSAAVIWKPPSPTMTHTSSSRARELRADRRRQREAHRAEAARGDELPRVVVLVVLRLPHLVLADVGHDERLALGDAPEVVHHVRGVEVPGVCGIVWMSRTAESPLSSSMRATHACRSRRRHDAARARAASRPRRRRAATSTRTFLLISAGSSSQWIFFARCRVGLELAGDAIVEAHAERDDEVGLLDGVC